MPATPPPRRTATESREIVLRAAIVEFAQSGLNGTTAEAIAERAGVSQAYVFRLFRSKKALFIAAIERGFHRVHDAFAEVAKGNPDPFEAMGMRYVTLLQDRDELLLQLHAYAACADPDIRDVCRRCFAELQQFLEGLPTATPQVVSAFLATGMLLNVATAIDLLGPGGDDELARRCLTGAGVVLDAAPSKEA